jgi:hypothetical protein
MIVSEPIPVINELQFDNLKRGTISHYWLEIVRDGMGVPVNLPVIVAAGKQDGPVLGLTAAIHGNELNGILVVQQLFKEIDINNLKGIIVGIPVANVPSLLRKTRRFLDGTDLNHIMPGKPEGNVSQTYAWRLIDKLVKKFNYLVDLHTASFGRINCFYVRADMTDPITRQMAVLQNSQIILHNPPSDGTLRGAADQLGIKSITVEIGNPHLFQRGLIRDGLEGILNLLSFIGMSDVPVVKPTQPSVICRTSKWLFSDEGGLLSVIPELASLVREGQTIATLHNVFGDLIKKYTAPEDGIVIGKEVNPVNQTGGRMMHLGIIGTP